MHEQPPQPSGDEPQTAEPENEPSATRPQIWVSSWLDYNNGVLYGDWLAADRDVEEIQADIAALLAASPTAALTGEAAEEWGVFDFDGFGGLRIDEQPDLGWVSTVAIGISRHGPALAAWAELVAGDVDRLGEFEDAFLGHYPSAETYAEQLIDDLGYNQQLDEALPDGIRRYVRIDTAGLARDLQMEGAIEVVPADDGGVWVFHPNW